VLGNSGRNQFRGPAYVSDNVALSKDFPVYRETNLQARFEAFNMTNTPAFGLPTTAIGSNLGKITSTLGSGVGLRQFHVLGQFRAPIPSSGCGRLARENLGFQSCL
jgi:hypothetical protein